MPSGVPGLYTLKRTQIIRRPIEEVFAFFQQPENLAEITPPQLGFVILTPSPIRMGEGALFDYTIRSFGIRLRWTSLITEYNPPHRFADVQIRGPYSYWHHSHLFEKAESGTQVIDEVRYMLPFGPLGRLVHTLVVRKQLSDIFDYRMVTINKMFG
jgi:ligand-binding SRPBCC domain-containing protein